MSMTQLVFFFFKEKLFIIIVCMCHGTAKEFNIYIVLIDLRQNLILRLSSEKLASTSQLNRFHLLLYIC